MAPGKNTHGASAEVDGLRPGVGLAGKHGTPWNSKCARGPHLVKHIKYTFVFQGACIARRPNQNHRN